MKSRIGLSDISIPDAARVPHYQRRPAEHKGTQRMMSLEAIIALNEQIAAEAAEKNLIPFVPNGEADVEQWPPFPFPNIGYLEPDGWEKTEASWFVDKTGVGLDWEPALSVRQFKAALADHIADNPCDGLAIVEEGEFPAVVAAFRPTAITEAA